MIDLPSLLLSYGVSLRQRGNEYQCLCFAHDDHNPSMAVYVNGSGKHVAHCYSCSFHEDVIGTYCWFNDLDPKNPSHFLQAKNALETGNYVTGKPYAVIQDDLQQPKNRTERTMLLPPVGHDLPRMNWLKTRDGVPFGEPCEIYTYKQPDGKPWYYEARWLVPDEHGELHKECRCFTYGKRGTAPAKWECSHHLPPRPLYGLDMLAKLPNAQVVICEGPRKALAAQMLLPSLPCIGWAGGANGCNKSDWSPLAGKRCLLWPDADTAGRKAMAALAQVLIALGCEVWLFDTSDMPEKWDAADAVAEGWDTARTLAWAKEHKGEMVTADAEVAAAVEAVDAAAEPIAPDAIAPDPDGSMYEYDTVFDGEVPVQEKPVPAIVPESENELPEHIAESLPIAVYRDGTSEQVFTTEPADLFSEFIVQGLQHGLLPKVIEDHIFDIAEVINTDPAFGALTAVATVAGLLDDRIKIHLNHGYRESARLWTVCVGEPSTKKSPIMDSVRFPLNAIKKRYAQEEKKILQRQGTLDARYKAKLKEYTEACIKSDNHDVQEPNPAERLQRRRIECDNLTREAFEEVLKDMPTGLIIHADELAGWLGSMDAYKSAGVKADRALWLRAYNGGPMQIDKVQRGSYLIENWSATITGGIQPSKLAGMAGQLDDDGLLQRFLIVCSTRDGGQGLARAWNHSASEAWTNLIEHIVETKPGGEYVRLSTEAAAIRDKAVAHIYQAINSRMISRAFCTALGKWEGTTGRMILIFHAIECAAKRMHPESCLVAPETAQLAVDYMLRHLLPHMVSFYEDGLGQSPAQECAKLIAGRIIATGITELKMRDLQINGPGKWRNATEDVQRQTLARLCEYGWIHPVEHMNNIARRPSRYLVNPHVHTLYLKHKDAEVSRIERGREIVRKIKEGHYSAD